MTVVMMVDLLVVICIAFLNTLYLNIYCSKTGETKYFEVFCLMNFCVKLFESAQAFTNIFSVGISGKQKNLVFE